MKITILLEDTLCRKDCQCIHGLSMHIETAQHHLLFDMGPDDLFLKNAKTLGIDIEKVDAAFVSHAHYDHCGGLEAFFKCNPDAPVYLQKNAFGDYYAVKPGTTYYIGLDSALQPYVDKRFRLGEGVKHIDDELTVFSDIPTHDLCSHANDSLLEKVGGEYLRDKFLHEQDLIVTENGKSVLFAGCAHNGIVNILRRAEDILGRAPDAVVAGFHLYNPGMKVSEPRELVDAVGRELAARPNTLYFTGHCTGQSAYDWLKEILGDRLNYMACGSVFEI